MDRNQTSFDLDKFTSVDMAMCIHPEGTSAGILIGDPKECHFYYNHTRQISKAYLKTVDAEYSAERPDQPTTYDSDGDPEW